MDLHEPRQARGAGDDEDDKDGPGRRIHDVPGDLSMTGEKKNAQEAMVSGFFDLSRAHFHSPAPQVRGSHAVSV